MIDSTATELLKEASYSEIEEIQLDKISRACKKLTDILPFENKNSSLLADEDIIKSLFICYPLLSSPVFFHLIIDRDDNRCFYLKVYIF